MAAALLCCPVALTGVTGSLLAGADVILPGYDDPQRKYYRLPLLHQCAPDYWLSESLLGHVRMKPISKIDGEEVVRMFKEIASSDRKDLIRSYNQHK